MLGKAFAIVHFLLVKMKDVLYYLSDNGCLWRFAIIPVAVLLFLLLSCIRRLDERVFAEVCFFEFRTCTFALAGKFVAVSDIAVPLD